MNAITETTKFIRHLHAVGQSPPTWIVCLSIRRPKALDYDAEHPQKWPYELN
jgi:hypothetical protein